MDFFLCRMNSIINGHFVKPHHFRFMGLTARGDFAPQRTSGNVWEMLGCHNWVGEGGRWCCSWHLWGQSPGSCSTPLNALDSPSRVITWTKMSIVLRLRNPGLDERGWPTFCIGTVNALGSWATFSLSQLLTTQLCCGSTKAAINR